jgi:hypothetical protein
MKWPTLLPLAVLSGLASSAAPALALAHEHFHGLTLMDASLSASGTTGMALVSMDLDLITMRVESNFTGLMGGTVGTQIHCCKAAAGSGAAMGAMAGTGLAGFPLGLSSGSFDITDDLADGATYSTPFVTASGGMVVDGLNALINGAEAGKVYLNISSSAFPGGEIRGFLVEQTAVVPAPDRYLSLLASLGAVGAMALRRRQG